jgi:HK97 family phage major capsid protein
MPDILTAKALREKRAPLAQRIQELRDTIHKEDRDFTSEERANWEQVNKDYDALTLKIQIAERAESVEVEQRRRTGDGQPGRDDFNGQQTRKAEKRAAKQRKKALKRDGWLATDITEEDRCLALQGWMRAQTGRELRTEHQEALAKCGLNPNRRAIDLHLPRNYRGVRQLAAEHRALSIQVGAGGGYSVPEGFVNNLEVALLQYAMVRQFADVMRTTSGQDLPWPTVNDTSNKGAILQENATVSSQDVTFGQMVLKAYKYTSKLVLVPVELLEDSAFDMAATLGELLGIRIGRIQADHFTTGTGASQPTGYITAATSGVTAASPTAIAADDLYTLKHSVDPAYRSQPGVGWTMHDQILLKIKQLKDGFGRYLWQAGLAYGTPDTLDGDPIYINQSMDNSIASGKKTVAYGALRKYKIRDVSSVRLRRLVERYADSDQEGFVMFMRADGNLLDAGTHPIKYMVH